MSDDEKTKSLLDILLSKPVMAAGFYGVFTVTAGVKTFNCLSNPKDSQSCQDAKTSQKAANTMGQILVGSGVTAASLTPVTLSSLSFTQG